MLTDEQARVLREIQVAWFERNEPKLLRESNSLVLEDLFRAKLITVVYDKIFPTPEARRALAEWEEAKRGD